MDFSLPDDVMTLGRRVRAFVDEHVIPCEAHDHGEDSLPTEMLATLRRKAREAGLWTPQLPREHGGLGLSPLGIAHVFEQAGRSLLGPVALNCAAPDEGNMHLLHLAGNAEQKRKYLEPLARGEIHSCFAMTEPAPGAGSDPTMMQTQAKLYGSQWVLNGHKWFTSGALGSAFAIVAAISDATVPARQGMTLFLVETHTPGFQFVRSIPTMGGGGLGGHCEVRLTNCVVDGSQILGGIGQGFALLQARLGPARLTHCMRWLGAAARAQEIAIDYAKQRQAFGKRLSEQQAIQFMLADSAMELQAGRLLVLHAAWKLQQGDKARVETSMCKVVVSETVQRVIDRAIQVCGAKGVSGDLILERLYREVRAFRIYDGPSEVHRMVIARQLFSD